LPVRRLLLPKVDPSEPIAEEDEPTCFFATDAGDLACVNIAKAAASNSSDDERGVLWVRKDHFRPARCLERSPFFDDIIVSVGDWDFNIWKEGVETPLFTSTMAPTYLRAAKWSPTRPGLLFVARYDGVIDVWDFSDQSHKPATEIVVGLSPISTMEFWASSPVPEKATVLLAVTDLTGTLHILQLSKQLSRPINNELVLISSYFDRELSHREYVLARDDARDKQDSKAAANIGGDESKLSSKKTALQEEEATEEAYKAIEEHYRELFGV